MLQRLNNEFGSITNLGILFQNNKAPNIILNPVETLLLVRDATYYTAFFNRSKLIATDSKNYAIEVYMRYPTSTVIFEFIAAKNKNAQIAFTKLCADKHNFAVVDHRYLIDPYIKIITNAWDQVVYDLSDSTDRRKVWELYGSDEYSTTNFTAMIEALTLVKKETDFNLYKNELIGHYIKVASEGWSSVHNTPAEHAFRSIMRQWHNLPRVTDDKNFVKQKLLINELVDIGWPHVHKVFSNSSVKIIFAEAREFCQK